LNVTSSQSDFEAIIEVIVAGLHFLGNFFDVHFFAYRQQFVESDSGLAGHFSRHPHGAFTGLILFGPLTVYFGHIS